jgi:hypothetical protein
VPLADNGNTAQRQHRGVLSNIAAVLSNLANARFIERF